jgi:hypothetical protein
MATSSEMFVTNDVTEVVENLRGGKGIVAVDVGALQVRLRQLFDAAAEQPPSAATQLSLLSLLSELDSDSNRQVTDWDAAVGPFMRTEAVRRHLGIDDEELTRMGTDGEILTLTTADGVELFPARQFARGGRMLPGITEVLSVFALYK